MKVQFITFFFVSLLFFGCKFLPSDGKNNSDKDSFYSDLGWGQRRIPLIKPYELLKVSDNEWRLELLNPDLLTLSIDNVTGVNVRDSVILVYSEGGTEFLNKQHEKAWFIIEPALGLERGFSEEKGFKNEVNKLGSGMKIIFHDPDSLYKKFEENRKINW